MMIKKILVAGVLLAGSSLTLAKNITNYADLVATLRAGIPVNAVIEVDACKYLDDGKNHWEEKTLGARFEDIYERIGTTVNGYKKMRLVATSSHDYVGKNSVHLMRQLIRIFEDGTTEVITQEIDPVTYKVAQNTFLTCQLNADNSKGVTLVTIDR
jgi:hypothetical protein